MSDDAEPTALVPALGRETEVVRKWAVALAPTDALALIEDQRTLTPRAADKEDATSRIGHDGRVFVQRAEDGGLLLWRRPDRNWAFKLAGLAEPVPYPDMLHVAAVPTTDGSEIVATWRRHPATKRSRFWLVLGAILLTMMVPLYADLGLWVIPLFVLSITPGIVRHRSLRGARTSLLPVAHAPLAQHELGAADVDGSAFRVGHDRAALSRRTPSRNGSGTQ